MMTFSHYSSDPLLAVRSVEQEWRYGKPSEYEKPQGFWLSVDGENDWASWCESENFGRGSIRHNIVLANKANILYCRNSLNLDCLNERYGIELNDYSFTCYAIDWARIASEYQGIVIAPYVWQRRLHTGYSWYYSWDCASGCIWDASAVKRIDRIIV